MGVVLSEFILQDAKLASVGKVMVDEILVFRSITSAVFRKK